jgi:hypothetical protein
MANVVVGERTVEWTDFFALGHPFIPEKVSYKFDRQQYEAALASIDEVPVEPLGASRR